MYLPRMTPSLSNTPTLTCSSFRSSTILRASAAVLTFSGVIAPLLFTSAGEYGVRAGGWQNVSVVGCPSRPRSLALFLRWVETVPGVTGESPASLAPVEPQPFLHLHARVRGHVVSDRVVARGIRVDAVEPEPDALQLARLCMAGLFPHALHFGHEATLGFGLHRRASCKA